MIARPPAGTSPGLRGVSPTLITIEFCNFPGLAVFCQQESNTNTQARKLMDTLTSKLAALAGTLFMNMLVMGAIAYCFALQPSLDQAISMDRPTIDSSAHLNQ